MGYPFFVYGTLLQGFRNHARYLAAHGPRITPATLPGGRLYHLPQSVARPGELVVGHAADDQAGYPVLLPGPDTIVGEVMEVDDPAAILPALDQLEGFWGPDHPENVYERRLSPVVVAGTLRLAMVYWYVGELEAQLARRALLVPSGDWRQFLAATGLTDTDG